ncbi:MAG: hypothetical protein LWW93_12035 [Hyphomicrobiales bacterium]|nr:hypothetical protein [Hyphomicrobiales bacterium]
MLARPPRETKMIGRAVVAERVSSGRSFLLIDRRLAEMGALLRARHGAVIPFTDDFDVWAAPLADTLAAAARLSGKPTVGTDAEPTARLIAERLIIWCPAMPAEEAASIAAAALEEPRRWSAADLGDAFALRPEEREALGIRTIRPAGWRGRRWTQERKERERARSAARRAATGAKRREEIAAEAAALAAEIAASGLSRATFFRRRAQHAQHGETTATGIEGSNTPVAAVSFVAPKGESAADEARRLGVNRSTILRRRRREAASHDHPDNPSTGPPGARSRARPDHTNTGPTT